MKVSLIISVYKDVENLRIVLDSLNFQTEKDFQIVVSEDGESSEMQNFLAGYSGAFEILHATQPDMGWQKNKALNNAILQSDGDYLIFIDGDCIPHHKFVENHLRLAGPNKVVAGKRVKLGPVYSAKFKDDISKLRTLERLVQTNWRQMIRDGTLFYEECFYFGLDMPLGLITRLRKMRYLKGCNMSFYREDIEKVNGFDEDYVLPAVGEDADLQWRMEGMGCRLVSARNAAVLYHLHHKESWSDQSENLLRMESNKKLKKFVCTNGLKKKHISYESQLID